MSERDSEVRELVSRKVRAADGVDLETMQLVCVDDMVTTITMHEKSREISISRPLITSIFFSSCVCGCGREYGDGVNACKL